MLVNQNFVSLRGMNLKPPWFCVASTAGLCLHAEWQCKFSSTQDYAGNVTEEKKVKSKALIVTLLLLETNNNVMRKIWDTLGGAA